MSHACVEKGDAYSLELQRAAAGKLLIEVLACAAEWLPQAGHLFLEPLAANRLELGDELFVVAVAIGGDVWKQRRERDGRIVRARTVARHAGGHQDRAGENGGGFPEQLVARAFDFVVDTLHQRIESDLLNDEPPVVALVVDAVGVPLAEVIVGAAIRRMIEIVRPRVDGQLFQVLGMEPGLGKNVGLGGVEDLQCGRDQLLVGSRGNARPFHIERNRADPLVLVGFGLLLVLEDGDRPIADVVVQSADRSVDDPVGFLPWRPLREDRFAGAAEHQRSPKRLVGVVKKQVDVEAAIRRKELIEQQPDDCPSLGGVGKRLLALSEFVEFGLKQLRKACDTVIVIDNNRLVQIAGNLPIQQAFAVANELIATMIKGIVETIAVPSLVNLDYADVKAIMTNGGVAVIGVGASDSSNRVEEAVTGALSNPLLDISYEGATGAIIHVHGGADLTLDEISRVGEQITDSMDE